jgi:hypothetical protein
VKVKGLSLPPFLCNSDLLHHAMSAVKEKEKGKKERTMKNSLS